MGNEYNGWTNYATWKVQLEFMSDECEIMHDNDKDYFKQDVYVIANDMKERVREFIADNSDSELVSSWAYAFVDEVNWDELAKSAKETYAKEGAGV